MSTTLTPEDVQSKVFRTVRFVQGYEQAQVDEFLDEVEEQLQLRLARLRSSGSSGTLPVRLTGAGVNTKLFSTVRIREGYDQQDVDEFLDLARASLDDLDRQLTARGITVTGS